MIEEDAQSIDEIGDRAAVARTLCGLITVACVWRLLATCRKREIEKLHHENVEASLGVLWLFLAS